MRHLPLPAGMACFIVFTLATIPKAGAVDVPTWNLATGSACQLSIPTIDTKFRPKATGARNESTTVGSFVICPSPVPNTYVTGGFTHVYVALYSIDGASRTVSCTAVTGSYLSGSIPSANYSTKSTSVSGPSYAVLDWTAADFGSTAGSPTSVMSVTCLLSPQTAVSVIQTNYTYTDQT